MTADLYNALVQLGEVINDELLYQNNPSITDAIITGAVLKDSTIVNSSITIGNYSFDANQLGALLHLLQSQHPELQI